MGADQNSHKNLTYIPESIRRLSLLTRSRPHSYSKAVDPWNWVRNHSKNMNRCQRERVRDRRQKSNQRTVYIITDISPNTWWRVFEKSPWKNDLNQEPLIFLIR
jgi:hypothetical protein